MPEGGFTTDGEILIEAGQLLAAVGDQARPAAERLAADTHLPAEAYGNVALPPVLNFTGELAQLLKGPYDELRSSMTRVVNRTAAAIEANGAALTAAGRHYLAEDEKWVSIFDSALPDELRNRATTGGEPDRPTGHEPDRMEG